MGQGEAMTRDRRSGTEPGKEGTGHVARGRWRSESDLPRLRVLMVTGEYPPVAGGVGDYTASLSGALTAEGADIAVLTGKSSTITSPVDGILPVRRIEHWGFRSWERIAKTASVAAPGIVHVQYQAAAFAMNPAINLLPAYLRLRAHGIRVVTTFHDLRVPYLFPKAGRLRAGAITALDAMSHASITTNQADLEALGGTRPMSGSGVPRRWLIPLASAIPNCPPPGYHRAQWRTNRGLDENSLLVCHFGFLNASKGTDYLVLALGLLAEHGLDARLLLVGDAGVTDPTNARFLRRVGETAANAGVEQRVMRTGFLPPEEVSAALLSSDICVLPYRDGASMRRSSMLAAMAHGLPVVTTLSEREDGFLRDGKNVLMVPVDNPGALAAAVERLWRDRALRERLQAGALSMSERLRWPAIARQHLEVYGRLLGQGEAAPSGTGAI